MKENFTQKDYILILRYYDRVLNFFERELKRIEKSGKKTLWYFSAQKTLDHLKEEKGRSLAPRDVDNMIYVLVSRTKNENKN